MPFGMIAAAALGVIAPAPAPADPRPVAAVRRAPAAFAWSPAQVRELIVEIRSAGRRGFDPADYGLAALQAELELCEQLWNTPGSRQLDMLARASALALAADYRRRANAGPVSPAELDVALSARRVGRWLAAQAPADASIS
jgi:hypothetical protein